MLQDNKKFSHIEVEWIDADGDLHTMNFGSTEESQVDALIDTLKGSAASLTVYKVYKEKL